MSNYETLYRAADDPETGRGAHFTPEEDTARAYLDNPGFGGPRLFRYEVELEEGDVADARAVSNACPFELLAEAAGYEEPEDEAQQWRDDGLYEVFHVLDDRPAVERRLRERGYAWVAYEDDYPEGAQTWRFIGPTADAPEASAEILWSTE